MINLSQDQHCGRKKLNSGGAGRIHCACMTSFLSASSTVDAACKSLNKDNLDKLCNIIAQGEDREWRADLVEGAFPIDGNLGRRNPDRLTAIKNRKILETWLRLRATIARQLHEKVFGVYPINNAWSQISFGCNTNGIFRATLDDPMHYSSSGMFMYLATVSFKALQPSEAKKVENYMRDDFSQRCSVRYDFPHGKFSPGFTNCTLLTASEKVGLVKLNPIGPNLGNSPPIISCALLFPSC